MFNFCFCSQLGQWIANRRTAEVQKKYEEIGGGSPILKWTNRQGELLCKQLDEVCPSTAPHKHYVAFRYVPPFTEDAFTELEDDGIERAVIFSQYPQYSCATSGSSFNAIYRHYKNRCEKTFICACRRYFIIVHYCYRQVPTGIKFSVIDRWGSNSLLAKTFADLIRKELEKISEDKRKHAIILFSAHSLPLKVQEFTFLTANFFCAI